MFKAGDIFTVKNPGYQGLKFEFIKYFNSSIIQGICVDEKKDKRVVALLWKDDCNKYIQKQEHLPTWF